MSKPIKVTPSSGNVFDDLGVSHMLVDTKRAAELIGIRPQTLAMWRSTGRNGPPYYRVGTRTIRYRISDVMQWMGSPHKDGEGSGARTCPICGKPFYPGHGNDKTCSDDCKNVQANQGYIKEKARDLQVDAVRVAAQLKKGKRQ